MLPRGVASLRAQFELERQLRKRILESRKEERLSVTVAAYAELFDRFPEHGALDADQAERSHRGQLGAGMVLPLTRPGDCVLEVGCGAGDVLSELAKQGRRCIGIEASEHMVGRCNEKPGVHIVLGSADRLDFPDSSFDLVFSQQVIEHLHPEDLPGHFFECYRVLRLGGTLSVETPNCHTGPQDVSRGFVRVAEGLHLRKWSVPELIQPFRQAGFVRIRGLLAPQFLARRSRLVHRLTRVPALVKSAEDAVLSIIPTLGLRTLLGKALGLDDIFLFGSKPATE
jgi:ubiquinone/menaquinone biosynthesis C-methylase UbiE